MQTKLQERARLASNRLYGRVAPIYAAWVRLGSLGAFPALYREGVASLDLRPGKTVLDVCCGTGELFPYLIEALGPDGHIVGCDLSPAMLARAEVRVRKAGWSNVTLIEADARDVAPPRPIDSAIFSICLSAIPWRVEVLDHVLGLLPCGAPVVVIDSLTIAAGRVAKLANFYNRVKGYVIAADPDCDLLIAIEQRLETPSVRQKAGGVYSLISGRVPRRGC
jgi:ubiquinone/menaquinone biosynthesis C-methylase UbiE